jgi:transcriptional regulator with XRE-family HTH domain
VSGRRIVDVNPLSELLASKRDGLSLRELEDRSARGGHRISHSTIAIYLRDGHPTPSPSVVAGLSAAFGISEARINRAIGLPGKVEPFRLPEIADRLNDDQRKAVLQVVRALLGVEAGSVDHDEALDIVEEQRRRVSSSERTVDRTGKEA